MKLEYPGEFSLGLQIGAQEIADLQEAEILFGLGLENRVWKVANVFGGRTVMTRFSGDSFGQSMFDYCMAHMVMTERKFFNDYENTKLKKL
ncbi:unnamed protein product [Oppiella nova]|uniref:Uncharacterized protein n=1 Tax=Oppiella nova TaxID=334625 RepID=A0A7R9QBT7_9ACAR|nr:unnamed protein product [Oppiella nova]CAG2162783.1 unnamed protein product [Oppiella nova]